MPLRFTSKLTLILCTFAGIAQADHLVGVGWSDGMYTIDPTTGESTLLAPLGSTSLNSLATHSSGLLISHGGNDRLIWLDPENGTQMMGPDTGIDYVYALAFDSADTLFAVTRQTASTTWALSTIDVEDGSWTQRGRLPYGTMGMNFAPDGTLYAWNLYQGLLAIDPVTGEWTELFEEDPGVDSIQSICFAPDGTLYGVNYDLFTIDLDDQELHLIAGSYDDLRGLAWVPEPGTALALLAGFVVLLRRR